MHTVDTTTQYLMTAAGTGFGKQINVVALPNFKMEKYQAATTALLLFQNPLSLGRCTMTQLMGPMARGGKKSALEALTQHLDIIYRVEEFCE